MQYPIVFDVRNMVEYGVSKAIILDGHSGAGKTTFGEEMSRQLNCPIVHGDTLLKLAIMNLPQEMKRIFGHAPNSGETLHEFIARCPHPETPEFYRELFAATREYIDENMTKIIDRREKGKAMPDKLKDAIAFPRYYLIDADRGIQEMVVCDAAGSSKFSLWNSAFKRGLIHSNPDERARMLADRKSQMGSNRGKTLASAGIREQAFKHIIDTARNVDFRYNNAYNTEALQKDVSKIIKDVIIER